tara:strand:- start:413 stop:754 length:342 start_codon:yes stop_codon:yes gene_type:complete
MKLKVIFLFFLACSLHSNNCEEEYVEGIGWKKIVYTPNGPIESLGRCPTDDETAATLLLLGVLVWGFYELYNEDDYPLAFIETNNLQILPYSEIKFDINSSKSLDVTLFRYSF